ncbi:SDR family oxidoreductase, partial [Ferrimicrobium sp.]|uniref:SDR family oxidoreductase n=1 Tax=Ferrimicrobium sp. TaxID=2926050 RepID=UPI00261A7AE8
MTSVDVALGGSRFFVTGATGFLGTALVERILRTIPDSEVVLLVRPGRRSSPTERIRREVLKNDCFDRLREELGHAFDDALARRVTAVAGDVGSDGLGLDDDGLAALARCDVVVHSAATVSFDAPLDAAVEVNLLGPSRVAATLRRLNPGAHLVAVSTAYV